MTHQPHQRHVYAGGLMTSGPRDLPAEVAVALSFNGTTQAVMMATPADLTDFALGFAMSEGIATKDEIISVEVVKTDQGIDVQTWLQPEAEALLAHRRRTMAGPVGCGLCGVDSIAEALREVPKVTADMHLTPAQICEAIAALPAHQSLHDTTRAAHAAAYWTPARGIVMAREDVGRHNALDKLIGALTSTPQGPGAVVMTSRVSIDLIQKIALANAPMLIAVSAPTAQAVDLAQTAGITLVALARPDRFECFTHPHRISSRKTAHVA